MMDGGLLRLVLVEWLLVADIIDFIYGIWYCWLFLRQCLIPSKKRAILNELFILVESVCEYCSGGGVRVLEANVGVVQRRLEGMERKSSLGGS
jgi:hypothetical protein